MTVPQTDIFQPEIQLALAHTRLDHRDALRTFFDLDLRLGRILAGTTEPMLGQMRLAWWRETLAKPVELRPTGDAVLDDIAIHWLGREAALVQLVDGWEELLAEPPLGQEHARKFAQGRIAGIKSSFGQTANGRSDDSAQTLAWYWALADLATRVSQPEEREMLIALAFERASPAARQRSPFKGIALLGALALRSLEKGGRPLMEGRGASFTALRAAIFGR